MLLCRQVAQALADHRYWKLPWHRRLGLQIHVFFCLVCGRSHRQVMVMQRAAHEYTRHELEDAPGSGMTLSPEARDRIKNAIGFTGL